VKGGLRIYFLGGGGTPKKKKNPPKTPLKETQSGSVGKKKRVTGKGGPWRGSTLEKDGQKEGKLLSSSRSLGGEGSKFKGSDPRNKVVN